MQHSMLSSAGSRGAGRGALLQAGADRGASRGHWSRAIAVTIRAQRSRRQKEVNPLTVGVVGLTTEVLRVLGVGKVRYDEVAAVADGRRLRRGDVAGVMRRLKGDFANAYFVTGIIDGSIYAPDCFFADPTIAFSGLDLWRRNLQLLTPSLIEPSVKLTSLRRLGKNSEGREVLMAEWALRTYLSLPWKPLIAILGSTEYVLNDDANQVEEHIERWSVSGTEALLQLFRPSGWEGAAAPGSNNASGKRRRTRV